MDLIEAEITAAKIKFEEDILRIGEKALNPNLVNKSLIKVINYEGIQIEYSVYTISLVCLL